MTISKSEIGNYAEKLAANYLLSIKYEIIAANFFNKNGYRVGEIDIIAKNPNVCYVFVEVKSRRGKKDEYVPEASITPAKLKRIEKAAHLYLRKNKCLDSNWRIDAISVILDVERRKAHLKHLKYIHY